MDTEGTGPFRFLSRALVYLLALALLWLSLIFIAANSGSSVQSGIRKYTNIPVGLSRRGDSSLLRFRELRSVSDVDIVFLGSSHCYRGFDPRIFARYNIETFNMGSTSQSPLNSYYLIRENLHQLNPKLAIIELYPVVLAGDGTESALDLLANTLLDINLIEMVAATRSFVAVNALLLELLWLNRPPVDSMPVKMLPSDQYVRGGFVERLGSPSSNRRFPVRHLSLNDRQLDHVSDIITLVQEGGGRTMLVIQPIPVELRQSISNYSQLANTIADFATEYQVDFIDFNDLIQLDTDADFYDSDHLNQVGVAKSNEVLISKLFEMGYFSAVD